MEWFRHDSNANLDEKLQEVLLDYGLEGYGLYWYCIELIVGKTSADNITFELKHDARVIARNTGSSPQKVEEMMKRFISVGLFENNDGKITCMKVAKRLMSSATSNPKMRHMIQDIKIQHDTVIDAVSHDAIMTPSDFITAEEKRIEEIRLDKKEKKESTKGSRLSQDWVIPEEYIKFCQTERPELDAVLVGNTFKDFWISKSGSDATKLNWFATWRNWVRNQRATSNVKKPMKGYGFVSDAQFNDWLESTPTQERIANE
jgi:hypothetical protein